MSVLKLGGSGNEFAALVDDEDFEMVGAHRWHVFKNAAGNLYARRNVPDNGRQRGQFLHTFLTGWPFVDHVNHDGLDNRRTNLRPANSQQNAFNARPKSIRNGQPSTSRFKGVSLKDGRRWVAQISIDQRKQWIGSFKTERQAALAYDVVAAEHFGDYAYLNLPGER